MVIKLHTNLALAHQREYANYFKSGFERHGLKADITGSIQEPGDIHVIQGPHYAKSYWIGHPNVILLDREYYHPEFTDHPRMMDWVSIGWMRDNGGRHFNITGGREPPPIRDHRNGKGTIFLADYQGKIERADTVRYHPQDKRSDEPLREALHRHRTAIGYQTSALVTAGLEGLEIDCRDARNIMAESNWRELLPYADWHYSEIQSGDVVEHLLNG